MGQYAGFQKVKLTKPQRSTFDLSHDKRLTTRMGRLTPILIQEAIPSDYFDGSSEMLVRLAPLLAPIYDQIECYVHYFFVPNRLLWVDWEKFITGGRNPGTDPVIPPVPPQVDIGAVMADNNSAFAASSLGDYLGIPILPVVGSTIGNYSTKYIQYMPFLAYQKVWFDYYRDRNFIADSELDGIIPAPSGNLATIPWFNTYIGAIRLRNYRQDYFTSSLPFTQRGEEVLLPLDGTVTYLDQSRVIRSSTDLPYEVNAYLGVTEPPADGGVDGGLISSASATVPPGASGIRMRIENIDAITNASTTIADFRAAYALQVWLERNAVAGSRYTESIQAHFGVRPQDSRLQRAEYIGGGRIPVKISEVVSTAYSNDGTDTVPLANMGGHGVTYGYSNKFRFFVPEHGFIIGICSIMNPASYHQGLPRMFMRHTFLDYPWPTFAKLGEQTVEKYELFASPANITPDADGNYPLFGYQSRYSDWKWVKNTNHGDFHTSLLFWSLTRDFASSPSLSANFNLFDDASQNRIFAVNGTGDNFWIYCHNRVFVKRPLPYFGTPNTLGFV